MRRTISLMLILSMLLPLAVGAQELSAPFEGASGQFQTSGIDEIPQGSISDDYILGPGDKLEAHLIIGDNAMALDYSFAINPEGKIFFPNISEMTLARLSLKEARQKMTREISRKYREKFDLFLVVSTPKKINIFVTGQVDKQGLLPVYDGTRISEVLKKVGVAKGGTTLAEDVYLKRKTGNGDFVEYKLKLHDIYSQNDGEKNVLLKNGDIIAVPAIKNYVYIYGEIARPGTYGWISRQTLSDYINMSGGPTARASLGGVTVTRVENGKPKVYKIDVSEIYQRGIKRNDIEILAGDVINIPGNFFYFADFASFANTVLLALTLYSTVVR